MNQDTRAWIDEAVEKCKRAKDAGVALLIRHDGNSDNVGGANLEALDIIVTSVNDPAAIRALAEGLACGYSAGREAEADQ